MTVYFISGQAADEKLFENLVLPSSLVIKHIHWIEPLKKETLDSYVKRLSAQINTSEDFVLIGVSLGGMVSVELNKILQPKLTIIISSIVTKKELPPYFKFFNFFKLQKIIPAAIYKWYNPLISWYFGVQSKREKELLQYWMKSTTKNYMRWSVNEIVSWKNQYKPANLFHIHGTSDRILPYKFTHADIKIENGNHLMVHNRAEEISQIIVEKINSLNQ